MVASSLQVLEQVSSPHLRIASLVLSGLQPSPPTLRDILGAYRAKGDGDRDMLLAMLNAKAAEDQVRFSCV